MVKKKVVWMVGFLMVGALLDGCSLHSMEMSNGPVDLSRKPLKSVSIQKIVNHDSDIILNNCPLPSYRCGPYMDEKYMGPGAVYAYAAEENGSPQAVRLVTEVSQGNAMGLMAGDALGINAAVSGAALGPAGIVGSLLLGGALGSDHKSGPTAIERYNKQVVFFDHGRLLWIARYYPNKSWHNGINQASHLAIVVSDRLKPEGWASGMVGQYQYRIQRGWNDLYSDDSFTWGWTNGTPAVMPELLPDRLTWVIQPWKEKSQLYYLVSNDSANNKLPFMDLATVSFNEKPGFNVSKWISTNFNVLTGWMVIYREGTRAVVWKDGQNRYYKLPKLILARTK